MRWVPFLLGQVAAVTLIVSAGTFLWRSFAYLIEEPELAITNFSELSGLTITNRSSEPIFVLRAESNLLASPVHVQMPREIAIGETAQPGATIHRELEPRVNYSAINADPAELTLDTREEMISGQPYEILYLLPKEPNPYLLKAEMTIEFVWRGVSRRSVIPIGAFLYKLKSRERPSSQPR